MGLDNENPTLFEKSEERKVSQTELDDNEVDEFDSREIFGKLFLLVNMCLVLKIMVFICIRFDQRNN